MTSSLGLRVPCRKQRLSVSLAVACAACGRRPRCRCRPRMPCIADDVDAGRRAPPPPRGLSERAARPKGALGAVTCPRADPPGAEAHFFEAAGTISTWQSNGIILADVRARSMNKTVARHQAEQPLCHHPIVLIRCGHQSHVQRASGSIHFLGHTISTSWPHYAVL